MKATLSFILLVASFASLSAHARAYAPDKARFLTMDPVEGSADRPISLNRYLYASASPVDRADPSGQSDDFTGLGEDAIIAAATTTPGYAPSKPFARSAAASLAAASVTYAGVAYLFEQDDPGLQDDLATYAGTLLSQSMFLARYAAGGGTATSGTGNYRQEGLDELKQMRQELQLPQNYNGNANKQWVLSKLEVDGRKYYGVNLRGAGAQRNTIPGVNVYTRDHAEWDAFQQAAGQNVKASTGRMWVDRDLCRSCQNSNGVKRLMEAIGMNSLEVNTPNGSFTITRP